MRPGRFLVAAIVPGWHSGRDRGHLYRGLGVRSLKRWFGTARLGFLWKRGAFIAPAQRELAKAIGGCLAGGGKA